MLGLDRARQFKGLKGRELLLLISALSISCNVDVRPGNGKDQCHGAKRDVLLQLRGGGRAKLGLGRGTRGRQMRGKRCLGEMAWLPDSCADSGGLEMMDQRCTSNDVTEYRSRDGGRCKVRRHVAVTASDFVAGHAANKHVEAPINGDDKAHGCLSVDSNDSDPLIRVADDAVSVDNGDVTSQLFGGGESERSASESHLDVGDLRALGRARPTPWQPSIAAASHSQSQPARRVVEVCMPDGSHYTVHVPAILRPSSSLPSAPSLIPSPRGEPSSIKRHGSIQSDTHRACDEEGSDGVDEHVQQYQQRQIVPAGDFRALRQIDAPPSAAARRACPDASAAARKCHLKRKPAEIDALVLADAPSASKRRCRHVELVSVGSSSGGSRLGLGGGREGGIRSYEAIEHAMQIGAVHLDAPPSAAAGRSAQSSSSFDVHTPPGNMAARGVGAAARTAATSSLEAELATALGKIADADDGEDIHESGVRVRWHPRVCLPRPRDLFGSGPPDWLS